MPLPNILVKHGDLLLEIDMKEPLNPKYWVCGSSVNREIYQKAYLMLCYYKDDNRPLTETELWRYIGETKP